MLKSCLRDRRGPVMQRQNPSAKTGRQWTNELIVWQLRINRHVTDNAALIRSS